ncbi:hypothetical protein VTJ49DRAFT_5054 [Mycothermus thermophilus]|uniref:Cytochrome P450 n=1 Tax=Humicola insolens TaxID=85995 RepID=A0ABR3V446_HUMIN
MAIHDIPRLLGLNSTAQNPMAVPIAMAIAGFLAWLIVSSLSPRVDPREPPLIQPRIPFISHILGLIRHKAGYHNILFRATRQPIATLPMMTGKMYAVWDPTLVAACLRNKALSTVPGILATAPAMTGISNAAREALRGPQGPELTERLVVHEMPKMLQGEDLHKLQEDWLGRLAEEVTAIAGPDSTSVTSIPNTYLWMRSVFTKVTTDALYGEEHNPFAAGTASQPGTLKSHLQQEDSEPALAFWVLESTLLTLTLGLPSFFTRTAHRARETLVAALKPYYLAEHDRGPDASGFVRRRAALMRDFPGFSTEDVA